MAARVSPGPVGTPLTRWRAERLQQRRREELALVRHQAEQWRNGLAAFITVILTASLVSGRDALAGHSLIVRIAIGILTLFSIVAATTGLFLSGRAAHGLFRWAYPPPSADELIIADRLAAAKALKDLHAALYCTGAALALLVTATGLTWFG